MYLSYSDTYEGRKKWKISPFVLEALESGQLEEVNLDSLENETSNGERVHGGLLLESKISSNSNLEQKLYSVPKVNVNQLSYSKVDTFKTCPLKYKFRYLFQIPTPSPHAANFGSSVHDAVNLFYFRLKDGVEPTMDLLNDMYEKSWISSGYESKAHENARNKQGMEMMERFFETEKAANFKIPAFMERNFRLKIGKIAFTGRIDRIDRLSDGTYEVIDYKTGKPKSVNQIEGKY